MKRTSMIMPIPEAMREEMSQDPFYKRCCIADGECNGVVQWHHNMLWQGRRLSEKFCLLPVCEYHHRTESKRETKDRLNHIMVNRMSEPELIIYSKAVSYNDMKTRLNKKYASTN